MEWETDFSNVQVGKDVLVRDNYGFFHAGFFIEFEDKVRYFLFSNSSKKYHLDRFRSFSYISVDNAI